MSKLEVGMWYRSTFGNIKKITDEDLEFGSTKYYCKSASFNIIDLIEVGDYVNGYYVSKIWKKNEITHYVDGTPIKRKERKITIQAPSYGGIIHLENKDIKSVLTKEQFESISYRIGE